MERPTDCGAHHPSHARTPYGRALTVNRPRCPPKTKRRTRRRRDCTSETSRGAPPNESFETSSRMPPGFDAWRFPPVVKGGPEGTDSWSLIPRRRPPPRSLASMVRRNATTNERGTDATGDRSMDGFRFDCDFGGAIAPVNYFFFWSHPCASRGFTLDVGWMTMTRGFYVRLVSRETPPERDPTTAWVGRDRSRARGNFGGARAGLFNNCFFPKKRASFVLIIYRGARDYY